MQETLDSRPGGHTLTLQGILQIYPILKNNPCRIECKMFALCNWGISVWQPVTYVTPTEFGKNKIGLCDLKGTFYLI